MTICDRLSIKSYTKSLACPRRMSFRMSA